MKLQARWKLFKYRMKGELTIHLALLIIVANLYFIAGSGLFWLKLVAIIAFAGFLFLYYKATKKFDTKHREAILKIIKGA